MLSKLLVAAILFFSAMVLSTTPAFAEEVGVVKDSQGGVQIERDGSLTAIAVGEKIQKNDVILTGEDGSIGVIFRDDTLMSLGPNSRIVIDDYVFVPKDKSFSFVTNMSKGTVSVATGLIGKLAPETMKFKTPTATLGVRGTRFLILVEE